MKAKTTRRFLSRNGHKLALCKDKKALQKRAKLARKVLRKD